MFLDCVKHKTEEGSFSSNGIVSSINVDGDPHFIIECRVQYSFKTNVYGQIEIIGPNIFRRNLIPKYVKIKIIEIENLEIRNVVSY